MTLRCPSVIDQTNQCKQHDETWSRAFGYQLSAISKESYTEILADSR